MSLGALLGKELRILRRSPLLVVVLVLYPIVIVGILGYAFSQPNQRVPLAIVNEDLDPNTGEPQVGVIENPIEGESSNLTISTTDILQALRPFADLQPTSLEEGRHLLLTGEVQAVLRFPPNFVRDIARLDSNGRVEITIDQSDPVRAKFMEVLIRGVVQEFQEEIVGSKVQLVVEAINRALSTNLRIDDPLYPGFYGVRTRLEELEAAHPELSPEDHVKLNESIEFLSATIDTLEQSQSIVQSVAQPVQVVLEQEKSGSVFIRDLVVPAALGLGIFWTGSLATSSLVVYERESPAYTRLRITPARGLAIYGSKILLTLAIILAQSLLILGTAVLAWGTRIDNAPLALLVILVSTLASVGLGLFLAGLSRDVNGTVLLSILVTFPMLFLAGLFYPVSFMPKGAQFLSQLFPLTHSVAALRGAMLRGFTLADAAPALGALLVVGVGLGTLGILLGKRLERRPAS